MELERGTLWQVVAARTAAAQRSGALRPIETDGAVVEDQGIRFLVRVAKGLARRAAAGAQRPPDFDPFDPPERELVVGEVGPAHLAVLNKFNVVDQHLLLVTKRFVDQDEPLDADDFRALWRCLEEVDGLGFYNGGRAAGASQRHKHLQVVSVPVGAGGGRTAIDALVRARRLPFPAALAPFEPDPLAALEAYRALLAEVDRARRAAPYNLLVTRDYLLVVPRTAESARGISMNALGFAGSLFVKDAAQLELVRAVGPVELLRAVCGEGRTAPSP